MQERIISEIARTKEKLREYTPGSRAHTMYQEVIDELERRLPNKPRVTVSDSVCISCEG